MASDRPTPRYGEMAPEGWVWSPPADPHKAEPEAAPEADVVAPRAAPQKGEEDADAPQKPYRVADAALSAFLLVTSVMFSSSTVPNLFALRSTIDMFYADRGLGEYGGGSTVDIVGAIAAIANLVLLAASIWLTVRLIGQRRRSWPVPLLIGALAAIVTFGCVVLALVADPGLLGALGSN
jgi:hypothetical protein